LIAENVMLIVPDVALGSSVTPCCDDAVEKGLFLIARDVFGEVCQCPR